MGQALAPPPSKLCDIGSVPVPLSLHPSPTWESTCGVPDAEWDIPDLSLVFVNSLES